jgi:type I restriction enzyme S subunit
MNKYELKELKDLALELIDGDRGLNYPDKSEFRTEGYCLFLNTGNVTSRGFDFSNCDFIDAKRDSLLRKGKLKLNDIVLTTRGTVGNVGYFKKSIPYPNLRINSGMIILRCTGNDIDSSYLYSFLKSNLFKKQVKSQGSGSAQPQLPIGSLKNISLPIFSLPIQRRIGKLLSYFEDKIELNNRINAELEAMAKTVYDYWFVQFDFPDQNGKPYKASGGKMVWNDELKREIPEGWEVCTIDEYAEVKKGELITAKDSKDGSVKVIAAGVNYSYFHSTPNRLKNTITISGSGANAGFINFWREPIFASDCITVRGKSDTETIILLHYLKFIQPYILSQATGSAQPHVYPSDIKILKYVVPLDILAKSYGRIVLPLNEKIGVNLNENQKLAELRDWLLPMLMNGQVKVKEAEEYILGENNLSMAAEPEVGYGRNK